MPFPRQLVKKREPPNYRTPRLSILALSASGLAFAFVLERFKLWPKWVIQTPTNPNDPRRILADTDRDDLLTSARKLDRDLMSQQNLTVRRDFQKKFAERQLPQTVRDFFKTPDFGRFDKLEPGQYGNVVVTKSPEKETVQPEPSS